MLAAFVVAVLVALSEPASAAARPYSELLVVEKVAPPSFVDHACHDLLSSFPPCVST